MIIMSNSNLTHIAYLIIIEEFFNLVQWVHGVTWNLRNYSAFKAEASGVLEGLRPVWRLGFRKVCIECDSSSIVACVLSDVRSGMDTNIIFVEISYYLSFNWDVKITHIFKEANMCADWLANWSLFHSLDVRFWDRMPMDNNTLILADAIEVSTKGCAAVGFGCVVGLIY